MSDKDENKKIVWSAEKLAGTVQIIKDFNRFLMVASQHSIYGDSGPPEKFPFHLAEEFAIREGNVSFESLPSYIIIGSSEKPPTKREPSIKIPKQLRSIKMTPEEVEDLDKRAFNYLGKFTRTSIFFFEWMIYTVEYYHGVADIDESLIRYSRILQYIDPDDYIIQVAVHKTYSLWQSMRFNCPDQKSQHIDTSCDCAFNSAALELYEPNTFEHLAENYPKCKDPECRTCQHLHPLIDICLALAATAPDHVKSCSFLRWQCRLQERHGVVCRDRMACNFCTGLEGKFGREKLHCFDWRMETPRTEEELAIRDYMEVEAVTVAEKIMTDSEMQTQLLSTDNLLHVMNCLRYGCKKPMCDELKILIQYHPNICNGAKECKLCDAFKFIFEQHDKSCEKCEICYFPKFQRFYQFNRLAQQSSGSGLATKSVEVEYLPPPGPIPPVKECTFMYFYKDTKMAFGCGSPPEALVFFDYLTPDDDCVVCGSRHYCNLCQYRLQKKLHSMQRQLSDWLVHAAEMKLGEMMRWTSLEIILKRTNKRVKDTYDRMREMLLPGHKLDPKFMELLFKKDFDKSLAILATKLEKKEYYPDSYDQKAKNNGPKAKTTGGKSEATKKKELKMAKKKDGKIQLNWNAGCPMCTRSQMCEICTEHMKTTTLKAQDSLKNILKEYGVLSQEQIDLKKRISFVDVFRKLDQDRRELIGKRILQMLEKVHDENIPVKYMDVWYNTDVNKKFENNTLRWKQVMAETNSRVTTTQALLFTGSTPAQPATQSTKMKAQQKKTKKEPSEEKGPQTPPLELDPIQNAVEVEEEPVGQHHPCAITLGPCIECPPDKYCKRCKTTKLCELQQGMLMAREFHKIQVKCGRKATKEEISAVLEDAEIEKIHTMMKWDNPEDRSKREIVGEYMTGMISTNWAKWMSICHDQVQTLQADKRLQWSDYEKIHMPLGDFDDDLLSISDEQDEMMPTSSTKSVKEVKPQETNRQKEDYEFGQWDEYEANDLGYAFTYEGNVPVVIIPKKRFMREKTKKQLTEVLETVKLPPLTRDQELAEHIQSCEHVGECDRCREFLLPLVRHYRSCHQLNCQRCESGKQQSANIYRWSKEGDNLTEAVSLVEQDLIRQRNDMMEEVEYEEIECEEVQEDMCFEGNSEREAGFLDDEAPLSLGYAHYIPENYQATDERYDILHYDILETNVNDFISQHCDHCDASDSLDCYICFVVCAGYAYREHLPYRELSQKCRREELGHCKTCDYYLFAIDSHMIKCISCPICTEIKRFIGKETFESHKRAAIARAKDVEDGNIVRQQPIIRQFGSQKAFTFRRTREEMADVHYHIQNCTGKRNNCSICRTEYTVDRQMDHLSHCTGSNAECETCREHGLAVATHLMACSGYKCVFCQTAKQVCGLEWYETRQEEYRNYHGGVEENEETSQNGVPFGGHISQMDQSMSASHTSSESTGKSSVNPLSSSSSSRSASSSQLYDSMSSQTRATHKQRVKKKTIKAKKNSEGRSGSEDDIRVDPNVIPNPIPLKTIPSGKKSKFTKFTEQQMEQMAHHLMECDDQECTECEPYLVYLGHRNDCKNLVSKCALCSHFEEAKIIHIQRCPDVEQCKYCKHVRRAMGQEAFNSIQLYMTDAAESFAMQHAKAIKLTAVNGRVNQRKVRQN